MAEESDYVLVDAADAHKHDDYTAQSPQVRTKIQKWLSPTEYLSESSDYSKHLKSYVPNTGNWLRESQQFCQ